MNSRKNLFNVKFFYEENLCIASTNVQVAALTELVKSAETQIFRTESWKKGLNIIYDLRSLKRLEGTDDDSTFDSTLFISSNFDEILGDSLRAFLVGDVAIYGSARQYISFRNVKDGDIKAFYDYKEVLEFMNLEDNPEFEISR